MKIYQLNGYPEEVISHAFSKTSRSNNRFIDMVKQLDQNKSTKFHEKWTLKYGHSSVAEHSIIHIAIEGISRHTVDLIQSTRLASYTEQSTRYQPMPRNKVFMSETWRSNFIADYNIAMDLLYELYNNLLKSTPNNDNFDLARFALPLGALVNLGMTINMRSLRRLICKLLASEFTEAQELAQELIKVGKDVAPTLLKHIKPCETTCLIQKLPQHNHNDIAITRPIKVTLTDSHLNTKTIVNMIAILGGGNFNNTVNFIDLITLLANLDPHDSLTRALEASYLEFQISSDYGSYYDMKRHRMATLIHNNKLTTTFVKPKELSNETTYISRLYNSTMEKIKNIFNQHKDNKNAIFILPNATIKHYKMCMNVREWAEIVRLRGFNPKGHPTYRAIGLQMYEEVIKQYPTLDWLSTRQTNNETANSIIQGYTILK